MLNANCGRFRGIVFLLLFAAGGTAGVRAECIDWASVPTVVPTVSWDGPEFHNIVGGRVDSGYLVKQVESPWNEFLYYVYDVRDPSSAEQIYEVSYALDAMSSVTIGAAEDSLCVIDVFSMYGFEHYLLIADNPSVRYNTPLSGLVALAGDRMYQTAWSWEDGRSGVGLYDISNLADIVELGFHAEAIESGPAPLALSNEIALVLGPVYEMQAVDFGAQSIPVVRGRVVLNGGVPANFRYWMGRDGDRVYYADQTQLYALDVSDPDNLRVEFTIPGRVSSLAIQGDLGALKFESPNVNIRIFRLRGAGSPAAMSGYFGSSSPQSVAWSGDTLYQGGVAAYDVSDPTLPALVGAGSASTAFWAGSYVQGGCLVTGNGTFPLHCDAVAAVGDRLATGSCVTACPNPFNPRTSLTVDIGRPGPARLDIYDVRGRWVRNLFHEEKTAGSHAVAWDGHDSQGRALAAGIYRARLVAADGAHEAKLTLLR